MERLIANVMVGCAMAVLGSALTPFAQAAPSSNVAWTGEARRLVASGDSARGQQLAADCASCHGARGVSTTYNYPHLAGQLATYTYKQLRDYKDGTRKQPMMGALVANLSNQDMADLAAWYASLPSASPTGTITEADGLAITLVTQGDGKRLLPPCASCHGARGEGARVDVPALAGQSAPYLEATMHAYRTGQRANDIYARMRSIAQALSEAEILALARYYSNLGP
jgi:cytochrome c553